MGQLGVQRSKIEEDGGAFIGEVAENHWRSGRIESGAVGNFKANLPRIPFRMRTYANAQEMRKLTSGGSFVRMNTSCA